jgi:hypothetical protein
MGGSLRDSLTERLVDAFCERVVFRARRLIGTAIESSAAQLLDGC